MIHLIPNKYPIMFTFNARERLYFISVSSCVSIAYNNFTISNSNRIKLYLTQVNILKSDKVNLDQLLNLDGIKLFQILIIEYYFVLNMTEENVYDSVVMTYFFFTL